MNSNPLIAICIATFKRPKGLAQLLTSLQELDTDGFQTHIIVVDNDPEASAREGVDQAKGQSVAPLTYAVEPTRGIVSARNRLVAEARSINADYIAFVDDDEIVDSHWLQNLYNQMISSNADVVAGPQIFQFPPDTPEHIHSGHNLRQFPSGAQVAAFSTGNVLIRTSVLDSVPGPFDDRFNLTGGSDMHLGGTLHAMGFKMVYCQEAVVYEIVPKSRATLRWVVKRGYRSGAVTGRIARQSDHPIRSVARHGLMSLARIIVGLTTLVIGLFFNRRDFGKNVRQVATGIGGIVILLAPKALFEEYRTIHGN